MLFLLPYAHRLDAIEARLRIVAVQQTIIIRNQEKIMSGLSDAQAAITNLSTAVEDTLSYITSQVDALKAAASAPAGDDDNEVEKIASGINNAVAGLRQGIAAARAGASSPGMGPVTNSALPSGDHMSPPTPVAPAPAPAPADAPSPPADPSLNP